MVCYTCTRIRGTSLLKASRSSESSFTLNIYFTYRMAEIVVEMLNSPRYEQEKTEHYVSFALKLLKKLPSAKEITAVILLYKKWKS